jgi:hypothetical protein
MLWVTLALFATTSSLGAAGGPSTSHRACSAPGVAASAAASDWRRWGGASDEQVASTRTRRGETSWAAWLITVDELVHAPGGVIFQHQGMQPDVRATPRSSARQRPEQVTSAPPSAYARPSSVRAPPPKRDRRRSVMLAAINNLVAVPCGVFLEPHSARSIAAPGTAANAPFERRRRREPPARTA